MTGNQTWAMICLGLCAMFAVLAIIFAVSREKGAMLISGFNTMSKEKQDGYNTKRMSADMKNTLILWSGIFLAGGALSYFVSFYFAGIALVVWIPLFQKKTKLNTEKAFEKYKL